MHNLPDLPPPYVPDQEGCQEQNWFGLQPQTNGLYTKNGLRITTMCWARNDFAQLSVSTRVFEARADLTPTQLRLLAATLIQAADHVDATTQQREAQRAELLATTYRPVLA